MRAIITLTTDFGLNNHYVGAMKGVLLSINRDIEIVDITHEVESFDIFSTVFTVSNFYKNFPPRAIHLVVVDPGVGGSRRQILIEADNHYFIGPDNGLFSLILKPENNPRVYNLNRSEYFLDNVSKTFHGRDIFAPVSSHLSLGVKPTQLGSLIDDPVIVELPSYVQDGDRISGEIVYVDKFGNMISNIPSQLISDRAQVVINGNTINGLSDSYGSVKQGDLLAIKGSCGFIEIAVNMGSAENSISRGKVVIINR